MSNLSDKLHSAPFIRLLVPFTIGIFLGDHFPPELKWLFLGVASCFSLILIFYVKILYKQEMMFGIFLFPALLFLGLFTAADHKYLPERLAEGEYFALVCEYPEEKEKSFRALIRLNESGIKVLAYFEKSDSMNNIEPGSVVWFRGQPELIKKTGNPFEFDYQTYLIRNMIGHRIYLKKSNFHFLRDPKIPNLAEWSLIVRSRLLKIVGKCGLKGEVFHLVSAISLGAREELEPETTLSFSKTGVIHVLAVSGMNVGIIYIVLDMMLRFLKRKKGGIFLYTMVILTAVWGYSLITALSASVLRATAMFTFIVIGKSLSRNPNIYNTLAASAFVLLCFNPMLLYDVGFQLSYAAVFSIVFFHPFIYGSLYFRYWIPDQIWALLTVSAAAQIGTLPLILHYFHQFPTWFLLANLMVIPLVTVILYLSFIVFAIAPVWPFLGVLITKILDWAGQGMLFSVHFIERLPYSVLAGLYPSDFTLIIAIVFTVLVSIYFVLKIRAALTGALISIIILLIFNDISCYKNLSQEEVVVFNLPGKTLAAITSGKETIWFTADRNVTPASLKYFTAPYEGYRGIQKSSLVCLSDSVMVNTGKYSHKENFLSFNGLTVCILNERNTDRNNWEHFPHSDIIILPEKSSADYNRLLKWFPSALIVDNRMPSNFSNLNNSQLLSPDKPNVFYTKSGGAVQISFKPVVAGEKRVIKSGYFSH